VYISVFYLAICKFASVMWGEIRLIISFYYASLLFILFPLLAKWLLFEW